AQLPPPSTLLRQVFGADRGPRQKHAVPATDGASIWLPSTLGLDDDALAMLCYRTMALAQAARARRGSAAPAAGLRPGLVADVYLLLEAYAADQMLAALLPGLAAPIDTLRRTALERRPPVDAFPPRRRPIERLARALLWGRCGPCGRRRPTRLGARRWSDARRSTRSRRAGGRSSASPASCSGAAAAGRSTPRSSRRRRAARSRSRSASPPSSQPPRGPTGSARSRC